MEKQDDNLNNNLETQSLSSATNQQYIDVEKGIVDNKEKAEEVVRDLRLENYEASIETMDSSNKVERKKRYINERLKKNKESTIRSYHSHKLFVIFCIIFGCAFVICFSSMFVNLLSRAFDLFWGGLSVISLALFILCFAVERSLSFKIKRLKEELFFLEHPLSDSELHTWTGPVQYDLRYYSKNDDLR